MANMKRGQAAMEFLMTYGWAILAAIVVIAVLAIYFRPSTLVSSSTFVTAPFYAQASAVTTGNGVEIELKNNGGEQLNVSDMILAVRTPSTGVTCTGALTNASTMILEAGQTVVITRACAGLSAKTTFSADIVVSYNKVGSTLAQTSTGTIASSITA
jgi:uncharacterized protein (UPF0333 family)